MIGSTLCLEGTSSSEVDVVVGFTFNTVVADQIEGFAVSVGVDAFSVSEFLSFLASSKSIDDLEALTVSD